MLKGGLVEAADAAVGAYDVGEGEGVPVAVSVRVLVEGGIGVEGTPVAAVVGGDVGAVRAYGDPGFGCGVVGYGGAVAVGWGLGLSKRLGRPAFECRCPSRVVWLCVVAAYNNLNESQVS